MAYLLRGHLPQRFFQGGVSPLSDVILYINGAGMPHAAQNQAFLVREKGNVVCRRNGARPSVCVLGDKAGDKGAPDQRRLHYLLCVLRLYFLIDPPLRGYLDQRASLTLTVASCGLAAELDLCVEFFFGDNSF